MNDKDLDREALLEDVRLLNQFSYRRSNCWAITYEEIPRPDGKTQRDLIISNTPMARSRDTTPVRFFPCEVAAIAQAYRDGKMPKTMHDPGEMPVPIIEAGKEL